LFLVRLNQKTRWNTESCPSTHLPAHLIPQITEENSVILVIELYTKHFEDFLTLVRRNPHFMWSSHRTWTTRFYVICV